MGFDFSSLTETEEEKERKRKETESLLGKPFGMPVVGAEPKVPSVKVDFGSFAMPVEEQPEEDKLYRINPKTGQKFHVPDYKKQMDVGYMPSDEYFESKPTVLKSVGETALRTAKDIGLNMPLMIVGGAASGVSESAKTFEKLFNPIEAIKKRALHDEMLTQLKNKGVTITDEIIKDTDPNRNMLDNISNLINETVDMNEFGKIYFEELGNLIPDLLLMGGTIKGVTTILPRVLKKFSAPIGMALYGSLRGIANKDIKETITGAVSGGAMGSVGMFTKVIKPRYLRMLAGGLGFASVQAMSEKITTGQLPKDLLSDDMIRSFIMGAAFEYLGKKGEVPVKKTLKVGEKAPPIKDISKVPETLPEEIGEIRKTSVLKPPKEGMLIEEPVKKIPDIFLEKPVKEVPVKTEKDYSELIVKVPKEEVPILKPVTKEIVDEPLKLKSKLKEKIYDKYAEKSETIRNLATESEKLSKRIKEDDRMFHQKLADIFDKEAKFKRIKAPNTGFEMKNIGSINDLYQHVGFNEAIKIVKMFKKTPKLASDVVLSAEDPNYYKSLPKNTQKSIKKAKDYLANWGLERQRELQKVGIEVDFKKRMEGTLEKLQERVNEAKLGKTDIEIGEGKEKRKLGSNELIKLDKDIDGALDFVKRMSFVPIPSRLWFEGFVHKSPTKAISLMKLLLSQRRTNLSIASLVERGIIKKTDIHPSDIIMNYRRRMGRDISIMNIINAAKVDKIAMLIGSKNIPDNFVYAPKELLLLKGYKMHPVLADSLQGMLKFREGGTKWTRFLGITKMMSFYNPLFLPMYDVVQGVMLGSMRNIKAPYYLARGLHDVWKDTKTHRIASRYGLFSKPFSIMIKDYNKMIEKTKGNVQERFYKYIKEMTPGEVPKELAKVPVRLIKQAYRASWDLAWKLDASVRMASFRYLVKKGFSHKEAAQMAAKFHGDYAGVPNETRRQLNKFLFTPTFKIAMGKLYLKMAKDTFKSFSTLGKDKQALVFAKGLVSVFAISEAKNLFMKWMGFIVDESGRRYVKKAKDEEGKEKELVIVMSDPSNMFTKYMSRAKNAFFNPTVKDPLLNFVKSNRWEIHPLYLRMYEALNNKKPNNTAIYDNFDATPTKLFKSATHIAKGIVKISEMFSGEGIQNIEARRAFAKESGKILDFLTRFVTFKYLRTPKLKTLGRKLKSIENKKRRLRNKGELTPRMDKILSKQYLYILEEIQKEYGSGA